MGGTHRPTRRGLGPTIEDEAGQRVRRQWGTDRPILGVGGVRWRAPHTGDSEGTTALPDGEGKGAGVRKGRDRDAVRPDR